jgi:RNA polymerase sigma-70 factor (ECF subfamily)
MTAEAEDHSPLERFRSYLHVLARQQLHHGGPGQLDASDIVQQTLLEACQHQHQFRGTTDAERAAWLRQMLAHNLADARRHLQRDCRDVRRERSLAQGSDQLAGPAAPQSSPSKQVLQDEEAVRLADALAQLPEAQREALILQHWHGLTLAQIGERLGRSPVAVAGLLKRGLKTLRQLLGEDS